MSLNVIIISALGILVLVVLAIIFIGRTQMVEKKNVSGDPTYFFKEPAFNFTGVNGSENPRGFEVAYFEKAGYVIYCCNWSVNDSALKCKQALSPKVNVRIDVDGQVGIFPERTYECTKK